MREIVTCAVCFFSAYIYNCTFVQWRHHLAGWLSAYAVWNAIGGLH